MVNPKLKTDLLKKLEISRPTLSKRAAKLKQHLADLTTENAVYIIASDAGLRLNRYLTKEELKSVADAQNKLAPILRSRFPAAKDASTSRPATKGNAVIMQFPTRFSCDDPLMTRAQIADAVMMARVYPYLYILENSLRNFIVKAMEKYIGSDWWALSTKKGGLKDRVEQRRSEDKKNAWHQKRSDRDIDYLNFIDLKLLLNKIDQQLCDDNIIPKRRWINDIIDEVYESRCVLCHMNPLIKDNISMIKLRFRQWNKQIKAKYLLL